MRRKFEVSTCSKILFNLNTNLIWIYSCIVDSYIKKFIHCTRVSLFEIGSETISILCLALFFIKLLHVHKFATEWLGGWLQSDCRFIEQSLVDYSTLWSFWLGTSITCLLICTLFICWQLHFLFLMTVVFYRVIPWMS